MKWSLNNRTLFLLTLGTWQLKNYPDFVKLNLQNPSKISFFFQREKNVTKCLKNSICIEQNNGFYIKIYHQEQM